MSLKIPPSTNYQSPMISVPALLNKVAPEGQRMIQCEVDWGTMGGTAEAVYFQINGTVAQNFSQICAFSVDNSACGADVQFIFPETQETLTIPAYTPKAIVEVFTNATQFFLVAIGEVLPSDITNFSILNFVPPPVVVPISEEQNSAVAINIPTTAASGTQQIVPTTVNGTVEAFVPYMNVGAANASFGELVWSINDGTGKAIIGGQSGAGAGGTIGSYGSGISELSVRFKGGLTFNWTQTGIVSGGVSVNLYYRTP